MADMNSIIAELRRRNQQQQQPGQMAQYGAPTQGGGGMITPQGAPLQLDYGSAAPDQQTSDMGTNLGKMLRAGRNNPNIMSAFRNMMGNTGLPGSGSALGSSTTGTLASQGATNMGAGLSPTVGGAPISFPGAGGAAGASGAGGMGGMMGSAGSVAWPAAAILALDKLGISPAKETFKGYAPSNIMEKIGIKGSGGGSGAIPQMGKGIVQFMGGDFKHGWKNTADSVKNIFRLKLF